MIDRLAASICLCLAFAAPAAAATPELVGVNLANAGFGGSERPGKHGVNYLWPTPADIDLYADRGATAVRISFLWERMQPKLFGPLDEAEAGRLDALVKKGDARGVKVIIDPHNYAAYYDKLIGTPEVPTAAFADFWTRLAGRYRDNPSAVFGLMNEPNKHKAEEWAPIAKAAVDAIRAAGAKQLVLVPGTRWSGAHAWLAKDGRLSNAEALGEFQDPANNFAFEVHQYFDSNTSGTKPDCVSAQIGVQRLSGFTQWLRTTGHKGFLGEFGASKDPVCMEALKTTLQFLADNADVWVGWTYWAAAPWFGNYMFNVYPPDPARFPQIEILDQAMRR